MLSIRFQSEQFFRLLLSVLFLAIFFSACPDSSAADRRETRREAAGFDYEARVGIGGFPIYGVSDFGQCGSGGFFGYYFDADPSYDDTLAGIYLPGLGTGYVTGAAKGVAHNALTLGFSALAFFAKRDGLKKVGVFGLGLSVAWDFIKNSTNLFERTDYLRKN